MGDRGLLELPTGNVVEYINGQECEFLFEEIFVRSSYFWHGINVSDGDVVLDLGSNLGLFSLCCASMADNLQIIAIEPIPHVCEILRRNLQNDKERGIEFTILQCGVADIDRPTEAFVYYPDLPGESTRHPVEAEAQRSVLARSAEESNEPQINSMSLSCEPKRISVQAPIKTIDTIAAECKLHVIDLLKIDVEGDEEAVLLGIQTSWPKIRQVVIEVHDVGGRLERIENTLKQHDYIVHTIQQKSEISHDDYFAFIPDEMQLFYVYAKKNDPLHAS
jgi:FkbM family methyltransferase